MKNWPGAQSQCLSAYEQAQARQEEARNRGPWIYASAKLGMDRRQFTSPVTEVQWVRS